MLINNIKWFTKVRKSNSVSDFMHFLTAQNKRKALAYFFVINALLYCMVYEKVSNTFTAIHTLDYAALFVTYHFLKNTCVHPAFIMFS